MRSQTASILFILLGFGAGCATTQPRDAGSSPVATPLSETRQPETVASAEPEEPVGPLFSPEDWHQLDESEDAFPGVSSERAYASVLAGQAPKRRVVVGVIDSGVDIHHEDLQGRIWTNQAETPGNGVDDDGNGYVDDVHGWNFIGGPDGRNVEGDTFEFTRELARLQPRFAAYDSLTVPDAEREEFAYYLRVKRLYDAKWAETESAHANMLAVERAFQAAKSILAEHFGSETFTLDQVAALTPTTQRLAQSQSLMLYLAQFDLDEEAIQRSRAELESLVSHSFDTTFDPREIVGDDEANLTERGYGNNDVVGPDPYHGTHVSGIIAAARMNGIGIDGIADSVQIMVIRAVPNGDERDKDVAAAIRYAVDNGANIINMSFGKNLSPHREIVDAAIAYAFEHDVLLVHGSGNDSRNLDSTLSFPNRTFLGGQQFAAPWLEVGASSWKATEELAASFTNYGKTSVDLFAPGVSIYSTVPAQAYRRADGTSMAAPVVSGVAALVMSHYPDLSAGQVSDILLRSASTFAGQKVTLPGTSDTLIDFAELSRTGGIVNAYEALRLAAAESQLQP